MLIPRQRRRGLVLHHRRLEEVLLLPEIDRLAHPRERVARPEPHLEADPLEPPVRDVPDVVTEETRVEPLDAARETVLCVGDLQLHRRLDRKSTRLNSSHVKISY